MDVHLPKYLAFLLFGWLLIATGSFASDAFGVEEVFAGCNFQGKESVNGDNANCTKMPLPNLWDQQANQRCVNEYVRGCQLAKIEAFCHQGASDFLRDNKCNPQTSNEFGADFYDLCCSVCAKGKQAYLAKQSCKRDLPSNANDAQLFVQAEFENCCSDNTTKSLRSAVEDAFDEELNICDKYGCEHFCQEIDLNQVACTCRTGFRLANDGRRCVDIDECSHSSLNECSPSQACNNLPGSYECTELAQPVNTTESQSSANETSRPLSLRESANEIVDTKDPQCKEGSYFDPHRNTCVDMIDKYDKFCLDEKCDTSTKAILEKSRQCPTNHLLNEDGLCDDIDECAQETPACPEHQMCINRKGFFDCLDHNATFVCESGLVKNGQACVDVDECSVTSVQKCDKNQRCINLVGSYECVDKPKNESSSSADNTSLQNRDLVIGTPLEECEDYQERNADGHCVDKDVCAQKPPAELCGPHANCTSMFGKARCDCHDGYVKNEITNLCEDKNECETGESGCLEASSTCQNLDGSYECVCRPGFEKVENGTECVNIDECLDRDVHKCHHNCLDKQGSFECQCNDGYDLQEDNRTCVERNQCQTENFCDGICVRVGEGKYTCKKCPAGLFRLDEKTEKCFPINECTKPDICAQGETCIDLKNGQPSRCVDLSCSEEDYAMEDGVCVKAESVKDNRPLAIGKRVIRLPVEAMNTTQTKTIYRFNQTGGLGDEVEFKLEVRNPTYGELAVDGDYFKLVDQKHSHNLLVVKPIQQEQNFVIEMNVVYKRKILHQSKLYVYIV